MASIVDLYCRSMRIEADRIQECLAAVNSLYSAADRPELLVGDPPAGGYTDLVNALRGWELPATYDLSGGLFVNSIVSVQWPYDLYELLFDAIAPFMSEWSQVWVLSDTMAMHRYVFRGGVVKKEYGNLVWGDELSRNDQLRLLITDAQVFLFRYHHLPNVHNVLERLKEAMRLLQR